MPAETRFVPDVLLREADTGGAAAMVLCSAPPRWSGPPLHHHAFDEAFYVLEGELVFRLGDELRVGRPGSFAFAPRDSVHTLANLRDAPARYLLTITPGGFERYFDLMAAEAAGVDPPASAHAPYPETIVIGPTIPQDTDLAALEPLAPRSEAPAAAAGLFAGARVRELASARAWYERLLGEPAFFPNESEAVWRLADGRFVYIVEDAGRAGGAEILVWPGDLDATIAEIAARGLNPAQRETYANGVRKVSYRDDDGNEISFGGAPVAPRRGGSER
jgi:quercetin dioxygenase-like cupin family protein